MSSDVIIYRCRNGHRNEWTRADILKKGREIIHYGDDEIIYGLLCQSSAETGCTERMRVVVTKDAMFKEP